jgi:hypothetical protein
MLKKAENAESSRKISSIQVTVDICGHRVLEPISPSWTG